ncbi:MAG: NUDIX domain-containing protein, partial [Anaerolineae bacterium]
MIEDLTANSAWGSWHLINGLLQKGENPMTAVKRKLFELTGYTSDNWLYMGSFMLDATQPDVNGH